MDYDTVFRKVDPDWYFEEMFVKGEADVAILSTQVLMDFYHTGFVNPERNAQLTARAPARLIPLGGVDPRMPNAVAEVERQITELGMRGFKWYTAEWRGESRGWKANDPMVFPLYEKCIELGVKNMHFHKGPAVEPLRLEHFDVRDLDEPAWLYPELNFIVDHVGLPRLDDFCWMAARCPNIYGSLAVALAFIHNQPRFFANVMANLLFWIGPDLWFDRIRGGSAPHNMALNAWDSFGLYSVLTSIISGCYGYGVTKPILRKYQGFLGMP